MPPTANSWRFGATGRRPDERGATCPRPCRPLSLDGAARSVGCFYRHGRRAADRTRRRAVQRWTAQAGHARRQRRGAGLLGNLWPKAHVPGHYRFRSSWRRGRKGTVRPDPARHEDCAPRRGPCPGWCGCLSLADLLRSRDFAHAVARWARYAPERHYELG